MTKRNADKAHKARHDARYVAKAARGEGPPLGAACRGFCEAVASVLDAVGSEDGARLRRVLDKADEAAQTEIGRLLVGGDIEGAAAELVRRARKPKKG